MRIRYSFLILLGLATLIPVAVSAAERLRQQSSPYLRLHSDDLVDWRVWGPEAKAEARETNRPILLSIGYLACHWCHVMRRESFTNPAIAKIINRHFIPVLIDREQRPDVDATYQRAAALMQLPTGWPLTMFLTADGNPFWGGTYFPPERMAGLPSFPELLTTVADAHARDRDAVTRSGARVIDAIRQATRIQPGTLSLANLNDAAARFLEAADTFEGGFGTAPKFPYIPALELLWRHHLRTGHTDSGDQVVLSLRKMMSGSLYDQIGGGFFRYATDNAWRVPHFEKMLDSNAQLLSLMVDVWRETGDAFLKRRIEQTATFLLRDMRLDNGAFVASLDADGLSADGVEKEGARYLWQPARIDAVLGADAARFRSVFGLQPPENQEGPDGVPYRRDGQEETDTTTLVTLLRAARDQRPPLRRDDKILADGNGMVIRALVDAGNALHRTDWVTSAATAFATVHRLLKTAAGEPAHSYAAGEVSGPAQLAGLGQMADAAITLFESTQDATYLDRAEYYLQTARHAYEDDQIGGFFETHSDQHSVVLRSKTTIDAPNPSGNAVIVSAMARYYHLRGGELWRNSIERTLLALGGVGSRPALEFAGLMNGAETYLDGLQIVLIGDRAEPGMQPMINTVNRISAPGKTLAVLTTTDGLPESHPAAGKTRIAGKPTAYVCKGTFCSLPVAGADELASSIRSLRRE